jgi:hypothetical protein
MGTYNDPKGAALGPGPKSESTYGQKSQTLVLRKSRGRASTGDDKEVYISEKNIERTKNLNSTYISNGYELLPNQELDAPGGCIPSYLEFNVQAFKLSSFFKFFESPHRHIL